MSRRAVRWSVKCGAVRWKCSTRAEAARYCAELKDQGFDRAVVRGRLS